MERMHRHAFEVIVNFILGVDRHERTCPHRNTERCWTRLRKQSSAPLAIEFEAYWGELKERLADEKQTVAERTTRRRRGAPEIEWSKK